MIGEIVASPASDGNKLGFDWPVDGGLMIGKSMASFDGAYRVTVI
jgi:hypothetical protein